jgi:hypothetical protein
MKRILAAGGGAVAALWIAVLAITSGAAAGDGIASWKVDLGMSSTYDNNILRYSDKYITRFNNREDEGRFHINTRDDLILTNSFRVSATMKVFGSLKTTGSVNASHRTYTHNAIKDWSYFGMNLRQDLSGKLSAQVGYSYIPGFYVRHYRDDDWVKEYGYTPVVFQSYDFKKDEVNGWIQYTLFPGTRMRTRYAYMRYFYNEHFTEYNCRNSAFGIDIYQTLHKNIRLNAGFEVIYSRAEGNAETDASNDEDTFVFGIDFRLPKVFGRSNNIAVEGEYSRTCYTTHNFLELDVNHAGRRDDDYRATVTYEFSLLDVLTLGLEYAWHQRSAETSALPNAIYLADEKNYHQYQIGLEARYTLNFAPSGDSEIKRRE